MRKFEKNSFARQYKSDLGMQQVERREKTKAEREMDRLYAQMGLVKQEKDDDDRKRFFDLLKGYQVKNDKKSQNLAEFMKGKDLASLAKLDEERMLREM